MPLLPGPEPEVPAGDPQVSAAGCRLAIHYDLLNFELCTFGGGLISAGASLNEAPDYNNWPSIFWRLFLVVTLQNNNRYTSARGPENFSHM